MGIALYSLSSWLFTRLGKPFVWAMKGYVSQGNHGWSEGTSSGESCSCGSLWPRSEGVPYLQKWKVSV